MNKKYNFSPDQFLLLLVSEGIDAELYGPSTTIVNHLCNIEAADNNCITFYVGDDLSVVDDLRNCLLICKSGISVHKSVTQIITANPKLAFYIISQSFSQPLPKKYFHNSVVIHPEAKIHPSAYIGPFCVIGKCQIGKDVFINSQVNLYDGVSIAERVIIESGTSIGVTGQIWAWDNNGKRWVMPQFGGVRIEEDCFIGSNISIARGALQDTIIKKSARIAHGTMIGHNCIIGEETFISNRVAIAGSTSVGNYCFLGAGSVLKSGLILGDDITIGAGAVVTKNCMDNGSVLAGVPAKVIKKVKKGEALAGVPPMGG